MRSDIQGCIWQGWMGPSNDLPLHFTSLGFSWWNAFFEFFIKRRALQGHLSPCWIYGCLPIQAFLLRFRWFCAAAAPRGFLAMPPAKRKSFGGDSNKKGSKSIKAVTSCPATTAIVEWFLDMRCRQQEIPATHVLTTFRTRAFKVLCCRLRLQKNVLDAGGFEAYMDKTFDSEVPSSK